MIRRSRGLTWPLQDWAPQDWPPQIGEPAIDPDASRRHVQPYASRRRGGVILPLARYRRHGGVGELHERRALGHQRKALAQKIEARRDRAREQRQARDDGRRGREAKRRERLRNLIGVTLDHPRRGMALAKKRAEFGAELEKHEALGRDAAPQERGRDRPGSRADLDDGAPRGGIDIARHGAGERASGGLHRPDLKRTLGPGAQEAGRIRQPLAACRCARGGILHARSLGQSRSSREARDQLLTVPFSSSSCRPRPSP